MCKTFFAAIAALALGIVQAQAQFNTGPNQKEPDKKPEAPKRKPNEKSFPLKSSWVVVSLNGKPAGEGPSRPTFILDDNLRAHGFAGCNNYSATTYPLRDNKLGVGPIALTRKACDKATMERERDYLLAFKGTVEWDLVEGALVFKGERVLIRFERVL